MNAKIIDGRKIAQGIADDLAEQVSKLKTNGTNPKLVIIGINPDERALVYIRMKQRRAEGVGIETEFIDIADKNPVEQQEFVTSLGKDKSVHGIILQLPLMGWYDAQDLIDCVPVSKDVDGLTTISQDALAAGKAGFVPATPLAVMEILKQANVEVKGKTVCVIGRSNLVGKPLGYLLAQAGAKVLVGHRQVPDLSELTRQADIIVAAAGSPELVKAEMIRDGAVVIDVGINEIKGKLHGDVDFESVKSKASLISPVPGGVGPMTVVMLLQNVVIAAKNSK
jgi:methylenetetrahydrofolate dehydrogenase (NADP+)/methenyltetrahydrofolate cyclohydrolase